MCCKNNLTEIKVLTLEKLGIDYNVRSTLTPRLICHKDNEPTYPGAGLCPLFYSTEYLSQNIYLLGMTNFSEWWPEKHTVWFFFFFFLKTSSECSNLLYLSMWNQARLSGEGRFWPCWHEGGGKSAPCGSGSMNEITRRPWTCLGIENRYDRKSQIPVGWNHGPSLV